MPADIVIHDNKVEVIDGPLILRDGRDRAVISADRISSISEVFTRELHADTCEVQEIEVGTGSPREPRPAGSVEVKNGEGETTLKIDGATGSLHFANGTEPMLYVLEAGTQNPDRPVISHSPRFDNWGLTYRDQGDKLIFQRAGDGVMTVGLGEQQVGIRTEEPDFTLHVNGQVAGVGAFHGLSDARCKDEVEPLHSALETVRRLRGVRFSWKEDACGQRETPEGPQLGFLAQEVQEVLPEVVTTGRSGYHSVAYGSVVPVLVEAIKEQQEELEQARTDKQALEDRLASLEARLSAMEETAAVVG